MLRKYAPGLLICGIGLSGTWGCAAHTRPLSAGLFIPAATDGSAGLTQEPADPIAMTDAREGSNSDVPKHAVVLPPEESTRQFSGIKPLDSLGAQPSTMPVDAPESTSPTPDPVLSSAQLAPAGVGPPSAPGTPTGVYQTVGGVVAVVNDTPIYANQILYPLNRELMVKAREMNEADFRYFATEEIYKKRFELIQDEIYFATDFHGLSEDDRKLAQEIIMSVRKERITAAGGSVEQARRKALEDGEDLDDSLQSEYRQIVRSLFDRQRYQMIQVTAEDMRVFYRQNVGKLYSDKDKSQFRVIDIDPALAGGHQAGLDKINALRGRALAGEDFAVIASQTNDNAFLKARGGSPTNPGEWTERNSYPNEAVELALWKIEPGQITPVIEANDHLYIARLEARHLGVVKPFDDPSVQEDIYNQLRQRQFAALSEKSRADAMATRQVETSEDSLEIAVEMAMQKYASAR